MQNRIKLMVIDDSAIYCSWPTGSLEKDPRFEIVGCAVNAFDAKNKTPVLKSDVLTLNVGMSGMSSLDFLREYLPSHPIPVVLVSSLNVRVFDALAVGAADFVREPDMDNHMLKEAFLSILIAKLVTAAASRVRIPSAVSASPPSVGMPALRISLPTKLAAYQDMVIATGASTGGAEVILEVLGQFSENIPGAVIIQHMPAGFTTICVERLNRLCKMEVCEVKSGDRLRLDLALLAPGRLQTKVVCMGNGYTVNCVHGEKMNGYRPSVDVLFDTVPSVARSEAMGTLLTGMGADGVAGSLRIRKNGAYIIGQDRDICVVHGMPIEAYKVGAVCQ